MKKWHSISFRAKMDEDDIRAMKKCFYDAMESAMDIKECCALNIAPCCEQDEGEEMS